VFWREVLTPVLHSCFILPLPVHSIPDLLLPDSPTSFQLELSFQPLFFFFLLLSFSSALLHFVPAYFSTLSLLLRVAFLLPRSSDRPRKSSQIIAISRSEKDNELRFLAKDLLILNLLTKTQNYWV
jgi:hypothetical protein